MAAMVTVGTAKAVEVKGTAVAAKQKAATIAAEKAAAAKDRAACQQRQRRYWR